MIGEPGGRVDERVVGIGGGMQRHHQTLGDTLQGFGPWQG